MGDRIGVLGTHPLTADGRVMLTTSGGLAVLVDPGLPHQEIARLHDLDRVILMPQVDFCTAVYLDGPLAGEPCAYAINELGHRNTVATPLRPGRPKAIYELVTLAENGRPAELRFIGDTT